MIYMKCEGCRQFVAHVTCWCNKDWCFNCCRHHAKVCPGAPDNKKFRPPKIVNPMPDRLPDPSTMGEEIIA